MANLRQLFAFVLIAPFLLTPQPGLAKARVVVETQDAFREAVKHATPGDTIVLANGVWTDFEIVFQANGTAEDPITLTAETKGKVILSGRSNLRLGGRNLVVSGLVFKNGYTPTNEVISFRRDSKTLAFHSRVTETVIDEFNNPDRFEVDHWVMLYGKHNRFDHNHLIGKRNKGVTLAVRLNTEDSQNNRHRIDHNYFGPRPILGSNGGETLRIGTSHYSLTRSNTIVERNFFDRCSGEVEIASNKSGGNIFRNNTFFESQGTLTLRHGNGNLIENNVFLGNGKAATGGIRVINADQTIRNNYMFGLKGHRFGGALVVMNGVPNSPINRYHQVKNARIENNSIINGDNIIFGAGSDEERSAVPVDSYFRNNLIHNADRKDNISVLDDMSGIEFAGNVSNTEGETAISDGFEYRSFQLEPDPDGLLRPGANGRGGVGINGDLNAATKEETGVSWYPKAELYAEFDSGAVHTIEPGEDTLTVAVRNAGPGDRIALKPGVYNVSQILSLDKPLTIAAAEQHRRRSGDPNVTVTFERTALFEIADGGSLRLSGLHLSGKAAPDNVGNALIRTKKFLMLANYRLEIEDSFISDLDVNHSFDVFNATKSSFANHIIIRGTAMRNITGSVLRLEKETDDYGIYNAEIIRIEGSSFENIGGPIAQIYRGGRDESTFGPQFSLLSSQMKDVGNGSRNRTKSSLHLHGAQIAYLENNEIKDSAPISVIHTVGDPRTSFIGNHFSGTPQPQVIDFATGQSAEAVSRDNRFR